MPPSRSHPRDTTEILFVADLPAELRSFFADRLSSIPGTTATYPPDFDDESVMKHAARADVIIGWRCTPELLDSAGQLKLWIFPGVGVQRLIEPFRQINRQRGVILTNCHGNTYATAQHAVALLLAAMNKVVPHDSWMRDGQWRKGDSDAASATLRNRRIGLLGYGGVNSKVHRFLSGFDVEFAILRKHWEKMGASRSLRNIKRYSPEQLSAFLAYVDVLVCALPETPATVGLIGAEELALLGDRGFVVNIGRGPVIDDLALYGALKNKVIAGAGIDVWYDYRPEPDDKGRQFPYHYPFHELDNVVLSPHRAASPVFDPLRWEEVVDIIQRFVFGDPLINVVSLDEGY